ncbi:hypothetical protein [Halalkalicoccus sp. NIPERK01]|uniref:hypothetical protein n=1 Tax=Halalkalicoccus sp. NIPERK01 TaxID=3053469 RepID=UPI00256ECCD8|nr:hypothetical protein [Halalkalicoccus sp. NIPERK01]MDL5363911.1 hypothetical protein [Halalkalicoccus sp. NIPERK01]
MIIVPDGDGTAMFDVYSATNGENTIYTVDLRAEVCTCADFRHREPKGGCKHIRRVKLALGLMPVPAGIDLDEALVHDREKYGVEPEPSTTAVATDGGVATETATQDDANEEARITGPHLEPPEQGGATYYRCEDCGRESLRHRDVERSEFHADGCALR